MENGRKKKRAAAVKRGPLKFREETPKKRVTENIREDVSRRPNMVHRNKKGNGKSFMKKEKQKQMIDNDFQESPGLAPSSVDGLHVAPHSEPPALVPYAWPREAATGEMPRLCLVGEAPGADEVRLGQPFVGRSGKLLDRALANAGIDRAHCLIANVFRLQPPGNKVDHFFSSTRRAAAAGLALARDYGPFGGNWCLAAHAPELESLAAALELFRPRVIVALGRTPLWALTGRNGIMTERGNALPCRLYPPATVIATFHPSYILRGNWALEPQWTADLAQALDRARTPAR